MATVSVKGLNKRQPVVNVHKRISRPEQFTQCRNRVASCGGRSTRFDVPISSSRCMIFCAVWLSAGMLKGEDAADASSSRCGDDDDDTLDGCDG